MYFITLNTNRSNKQQISLQTLQFLLVGAQKYFLPRRAP